MARGPRVPLIVATSTWVCVLAEVPPDGVHPLSSGGDQGGGPVREGRRAGHRQGVVVRLRAHAGGAGPPDEPDADVQDDHPFAGGHAGLVGGVRVTIAAMESTSTYWKAPFYCLEWSRAHRPSHVVYRIIGEQWDPRCHDIRDGLTVNGVPFTFHLRDSDSGRQLDRKST